MGSFEAESPVARGGFRRRIFERRIASVNLQKGNKRVIRNAGISCDEVRNLRNMAAPNRGRESLTRTTAEGSNDVGNSGEGGARRPLRLAQDGPMKPVCGATSARGLRLR